MWVSPSVGWPCLPLYRQWQFGGSHRVDCPAWAASDGLDRLVDSAAAEPEEHFEADLFGAPVLELAHFGPVEWFEGRLKFLLHSL